MDTINIKTYTNDKQKEENEEEENAIIQEKKKLQQQQHNIVVTELKEKNKKKEEKETKLFDTYLESFENEQLTSSELDIYLENVNNACERNYKTQHVSDMCKQKLNDAIIQKKKKLQQQHDIVTELKEKNKKKEEEDFNKYIYEFMTKELPSYKDVETYKNKIDKVDETCDERYTTRKTKMRCKDEMKRILNDKLKETAPTVIQAKIRQHLSRKRVDDIREKKNEEEYYNKLLGNLTYDNMDSIDDFCEDLKYFKEDCYIKKEKKKKYLIDKKKEIEKHDYEQNLKNMHDHKAYDHDFCKDLGYYKKECDTLRKSIIKKVYDEEDKNIYDHMETYMGNFDIDKDYVNINLCEDRKSVV
jgi:hypothetical protein